MERDLRHKLNAMLNGCNDGIQERIVSFLESGHITPLSVGAYLGLENTNDQKVRAEFRAVKLLQYVGFLPTHDTVVFCDQPLVNSRGDPLQFAPNIPKLCGKVMRVNVEPSRILGWRWRCTGTHNLPGIRKADPDKTHKLCRASPLEKTFLEYIHLPFRDFLKIIVVFINSGSIRECLNLGMSRASACGWFQLIREVLAVVAWHEFEPIGGPGDVVEIDEVRLFKRKSNCGRIPKGHHWVFGGISRVTGRRFAMRVRTRDRGTLHAEIISSIREGSIICSDGWAAYRGIESLRVNRRRRYRDHLVVIHQRNFLNPPRNRDPMWRNDIAYECRDMQFVGPVPRRYGNGYPPYLPFRCHTQRVERNWLQLRRRVRSTVSFPVVDRYIGSYMYESNILNPTSRTLVQRLRKILEDIQRVYPGRNIVPIRANRPASRSFVQTFQWDLCECDECSM